MPPPKRILILFSDTGGGHRSAAEAIGEAFQSEFGSSFKPILIDALKDYTPLPIRFLPALYPEMVRVPSVWGLGYRLLDGQRRSAAVSHAVWRYAQRASNRLVAQHQPEAVISVHPLLHRSMIPNQVRRRTPFITVVTDMVSVHWLWYQGESDLYLVATEEARQRALAAGLNPEAVRVVGMPVSARHVWSGEGRQTLRRQFGWPQDLPVVLVMGGGEGMGPLYQTARAISELPIPMALAVVAGRNQRLQLQLEQNQWGNPVFVYGFERRLPEMMRAADLLVTKAGPGSIAEAINANLPLVLYDRLPGQEDGNVAYVVQHKVGEWAPGPTRAARAVASYLQQPERLRNASRTCRKIARPDAAMRIVHNVNSLLSARAMRPVSS